MKVGTDSNGIPNSSPDWVHKGEIGGFSYHTIDHLSMHWNYKVSSATWMKDHGYKIYAISQPRTPDFNPVLSGGNEIILY